MHLHEVLSICLLILLTCSQRKAEISLNHSAQENHTINCNIETGDLCNITLIKLDTTEIPINASSKTDSQRLIKRKTGIKITDDIFPQEAMVTFTGNETRNYIASQKATKTNSTMIIEQILEEINDLLMSQNPIYISDVEPIIVRLSNVLYLLEEDEIINAYLLLTLDLLSTRIDLGNFDQDSIIAGNVSLLMIRNNEQMPLTGFRIINTGSDVFTSSSFQYLYDDQNEQLLSANVSEAVVYFPSTMTFSIDQIGFVVFKQNQHLATFLSNANHDFPRINTNVISVNAGQRLHDEIQYYFKPITDATEQTCVSWQLLSPEQIVGAWIQWYCSHPIEQPEPGMLHRCDCNDTSYVAQYGNYEHVTYPDSTTEISMNTTHYTTTSDYTTVTFTTTSRPLTPEEQLEQIVDDIREILDDTDPIFIIDIHDIFDQIDDLLTVGEELVFSEMLKLLEKLSYRIDLNNVQTDSLVKDNIALLVADAGDLNPIRGLRLATSDYDAFNHEDFVFLTDINISDLSINESEAVVNLPPSVHESPRRISFVVFRNDRAFHYEGLAIVNSRVVSVNIEDVTHFHNGEMLRIHFKSLIDPERDQRRTCGYWHFSTEASGYWSQEGCTFIRSRDPTLLDTCQCDHLTHFAEILIPRPVFSERNEKVLEILSIIGCCLSILGILLIILTAILYKAWRSNFRNQTWLQLCIALFILTICFLVVVFVKYEDYSVSCLLTGIFLHYSLLASFCWMLVAAIIAYVDTVAIKFAFSKRVPRKVLTTSSFSWGIPIVVIGILFLAAPQSYMGHFGEMNPSSSFCYPSGLGLWLSVYAPVGMVLVTNMVLFMYIMGAISNSSRNKNLGKQNVNDVQEAVKCARIGLVLAFLFGLPWLFGLLAFNIVAAYFFTITVTTQGFILFLFIVCGNKDTRNFWVHQLKRKFKGEYKPNSSKRNVTTNSMASS